MIGRSVKGFELDWHGAFRRAFWDARRCREVWVQGRENGIGKVSRRFVDVVVSERGARIIYHDE